MKLPIFALLVASSRSTDRGQRYPSEPPELRQPQPKGRRSSWRDRLRRRRSGERTAH